MPDPRTSETPIQTAASLLEDETSDMVISAALLRRRLQLLEEHRGPNRGFDLNTISSLLTRMRDAIEAYRIAVAVKASLEDAERRSAST